MYTSSDSRRSFFSTILEPFAPNTWGDHHNIHKNLQTLASDWELGQIPFKSYASPISRNRLNSNRTDSPVNFSGVSFISPLPNNQRKSPNKRKHNLNGPATSLAAVLSGKSISPERRKVLTKTTLLSQKMSSTTKQKENSKENMTELSTISSDEPSDPIPIPPPVPPPPPRAAAKYLRKNKKLKTLAWIPLPESKINSTFWKENSAQIPELEKLIDKDFEDLFANSPTTIRNRSQSIGQLNRSSNGGCTLISIQRANNIAILLSSFKLKSEDIKNAIIRMDEEIITIERVKQLRSMIPNDDERKKLLSYDGDKLLLSNSEKFLLNLLEIPRIQTRLELLHLKLQLSSILNEMNDCIDVVISACQEVRSSEKFSAVLKWVLTIGSVMNHGTYLSSSGFKLESLLKLGETKSAYESMTLLHYLASIIERKNPEILRFYEEFPNVPKAAQVSIDLMFNELIEINSTLKLLKSELDEWETKSDGSDVQDDKFLEKMKPFYEQALKDVRITHEKMEELADSFKSLSSYFGEENTNEKFARGFFSTLYLFSVAFEKASREVKKYKMIK